MISDQLKLYIRQDERACMTEKEMEDYLIPFLEYLDELRNSKETNMWGAAEYVEQEFWIAKPFAKEILLHWMATYHTRHPKGEKG